MIGHSADLSYTKHHMWVRMDKGAKGAHTATIGITEELVEQLAEIFGIDMPMVGDELDMDTFCIHLHLKNRIHHLRSPLTGRVTEINRDVLDNANLLHLSAYKNWLYRMEYDDPEEVHLLMSADQYSRFLDHL
jgi:glycine cleavage system H protein